MYNRFWNVQILFSLHGYSWSSTVRDFLFQDKYLYFIAAYMIINEKKIWKVYKIRMYIDKIILYINIQQLYDYSEILFSLCWIK